MAAETTSLRANKQSVSSLLKAIKGHKFIIPDYQRPYRWGIDKCDILWNDIIENSILPDEYFLGTIVTFFNNGNCEIIDGQQRITSFFLLLRAFYKKLESSDQASENVIGLKNQVAPCIWETDEISQKVTDFSLIHIESKVAVESDNDIFHDILKTGESDNDNNDNYSVNYRYFRQQCDDFAKNNPTEWEKLCIFFLNKCVILPIQCDLEDTALTIFNTLNDRGLPLSDSDIFKAKLYRNRKIKEDQSIFTEIWKDLTEICKQAGLEIDDIFRYYMHVIRSRKDDNSREVGLRRFYADKKYSYLKDEKLLEEIMLLANFWMYVNTREETNDEDGYKISLEAKKWLHCLSWYPNDYWKYPVSVFFLKNRLNDDFDRKFCALLKNEIAYFFAQFIITPTINAVRDAVYNLYISISKNNEPKFSVEFNQNILENRLQEYTSPRISRALLLLHAYLDNGQTELIPVDFHIEHIFPRKWQNTNYNGWDEAAAKKYLEWYGNKIVFEQKLNIQAGNGYFGKKKSKYAESGIFIVRELGKLAQNDWVKKDIEERELKFIISIMDFFNRELFNNKDGG